MELVTVQLLRIEFVIVEVVAFTKVTSEFVKVVLNKFESTTFHHVDNVESFIVVVPVVDAVTEAASVGE